MNSFTLDTSQLKAARVVGFGYLFVTITAYFSEFFVRSSLIVWDDLAATIANMLQSERLFRIGIASDVSGFAGDIVLAMAFYIFLKPVKKEIALLGAFFRVAHATILCVITLNSLIALRFLSGADYLNVFDPGQLHALARFFLGVHGTGYNVALILFSMGSICTSYLLFKSHYIPKLLAAWGVFGSVLALVCTVGFIIFPSFQVMASPACYLPIGSFEIVAGFWLAIRGARTPGATGPDKANG